MQVGATHLMQVGATHLMQVGAAHLMQVGAAHLMTSTTGLVQLFARSWLEPTL